MTCLIDGLAFIDLYVIKLTFEIENSWIIIRKQKFQTLQMNDIIQRYNRYEQSLI